jgi:putative ABC transport system permease protein
MFKNMLKRSWLSTVRKPSRTIILIIILFVMANMLLATIAIRNSVNKSVEYAKEKLGGTVYLTVDSAKIQAKVTAAEKAGTTPDITMPTISEDLAKGIAKSKYLKDSTYSLVATANASSFKVVTTAQNEREQQFQGALDDAKTQVEDQVKEYNNAVDSYNSTVTTTTTDTTTGKSTTSAPKRGGPGKFNFNMNIDISDPTLSQGDTTVQGINSYDFISDVQSGAMTIVSGKSFDESTTDGVIISKQVADADSIKVGDTITLKTATDATEVSLKVVGIYADTTDNFNYNTIYMNIETAKKFLTADQLKNLTVSNVTYYLTSASNKDAFLKEIAKEYPNLSKDMLKLDIDDSSYQTMVGPIENVGSFAQTVMWIVMAAAVVIITLIVVINVKDRRYEMGVLLSLGSKRAGILGQIFIELVIVGTVAFIASMGTSQILAQKMGEGLLAQQVASSKTTTTTATTTGGPGNRGAARTTTPKASAIDKIDVSAGLKEYAILFGAGYAILIIAMILPSINILRYQPKTILTGKE